MNELIKVTQQNGKQVVSARELHQFLGSKQQFANWIKGRIEKYGLIKGKDYEVFCCYSKKINGGRPLTEYALTIGASIELAIAEKNEKGKQARRHFVYQRLDEENRQEKYKETITKTTNYPQKTFSIKKALSQENNLTDDELKFLTT